MNLENAINALTITLIVTVVMAGFLVWATVYHYKWICKHQTAVQFSSFGALTLLYGLAAYTYYQLVV